MAETAVEFRPSAPSGEPDPGRRAAEDLLRTMFQQAPGFICVLRGPDHVFEMANDAYRRLVGPRDLIGRPLCEALPEIVDQDFVGLLDRVYATGIAHQGRGARVLLDREPGARPAEHFVDFIYQPIAAADGSVTGIFVQGHDVTDHKRAEQALRASEATLQSALRAGKSAAFEIDLRTGRTVRSATAHEPFDLRTGTYEEFAERVHGEDRAVLEAVLREAQSSGRSEGAEIRFRRRDGEVVWLSVRVQAAFDETGEAVSISGLGTDITERKRSEDRIAYQASLLDAVEQSVMATDLDGRIVYQNAFAERLYGWTAEEALGRHVVELTSGNDPVKAAATMAFLANGGSWSGEFPAKHKDGSIFPAYVVDSPIYDTSGRQIGIVGVSHDIRQQKQVEAELKEKSAFLEATLENMDQGLVVADAEGRVRLYNKRAIDLLDLPAELMAGLPLMEEVRAFQESRGEFKPEDSAILSQCAGHGYLAAPAVYERTRPDGTIVEFRTVRLPAGGAIRTYTDVTTRRRAEAELRTREERYRALVEASAAIVWRSAPDGAIIEGWGWETFCGQTPEEHRGYGWLDAVHPDDREQVVATWQRFLAAGEAGSQEYRVRHVDGQYRWTLARGVPIRDAAGTIQEWVGTLTDVHDQRISSERLRQSREELRAALEANRTILEHSLDVICTVDGNGAFVQVSPHAAEVWGYSPEELVGRRYIELVHPEDVEKTNAVAGQIMAGVPTSAFENRFIRKDGTPVSLLWSSVWSPEHERMFAVARDLTERLQAEERLRQSQKMEAIGALTGGVAHDFNNLLTVILGNAEVLVEDARIPADARQLVTMVMEAAERGADLTQHLLAFGRRQALKPVPLRLDHVVQGITPLLQRTIGEHIELRTEFAPVLSSALVDRSLLESAILNLAVNARDAMPQGGTLTIRTGERTLAQDAGALRAGRRAVSVTVSDTGTGMTPETLSRVFEPFFTTKEVGKGSGLGLAMVYGFAEQSGGRACIESTLGQGTSVTILLPCAVPDEAPAESRSPSVGLPGGRERILLVEDEPQVLQFVSGQLLGLGYEVTAVANGPDALAALRQDRSFDLLLTDVVLPKGMSGVEVAAAAKALQPNLKVLFTSGYSEDVFQSHGKGAGEIPLLRKPYRRKQLAEMLRAVLG